MADRSRASVERCARAIRCGRLRATSLAASDPVTDMPSCLTNSVTARELEDLRRVQQIRQYSADHDEHRAHDRNADYHMIVAATNAAAAIKPSPGQ